MMDEEMEDFVSEIDFACEFDASMFFDFTRDESPAETWEAEMWFDSAQSYPPSPVMVKLALEEKTLNDIRTSSRSMIEGNMNLVSEKFDAHLPVFSVVDVTNTEGDSYRRKQTMFKGDDPPRVLTPHVELTSGLTFYNHVKKDKIKDRTRYFAKPSLTRSSTLMKPTACQLAKQNHPRSFVPHRLQTVVQNNNEEYSYHLVGVENQAAKRQKLDGGQLRKVPDMIQQVKLAHKAPKKNAAFDGDTTHAKLKLTIPREPQLQTANRPQRIRPQNNSELECLSWTTHGFKALPLNIKILQGPSLALTKKSIPRVPDFQVFHLKTSERANKPSSVTLSHTSHHSSTNKISRIPTTSLIEDNKDLRRQTSTSAAKQDGCDIMHTFKALPPNKKIFSSKRDMGVFRSTKQGNTVPVEFNFHTRKRTHQDPPIELFSELSLASKVQPRNETCFKSTQPTIHPCRYLHDSVVLYKGSKENRTCIPTKNIVKSYW